MARRADTLGTGTVTLGAHAADVLPGAIETASAPAKLNLSLSVLARRADGFHAIESLMVPVSLADSLVVRGIPGSDVRLAVRFGGRLAGPAGAPLRRDVPSNHSNLVVRAARLLADEAGVEGGLEIELVKRIPSGAGLGGGSSDAAALLRAAARLWGLDWPAARLAAIGARLGSDIPWFFAGGAAIASGRGERILPVAGLPALHAVIASPATGLSTAAVYGACVPDPSRAGASARLAEALARHDLPAALGLLHNDLEPPARSLCGDVDRLLGALARAGGMRPMLTGSGSACFALARSGAESRAVASRVASAGWPGVFAVRVGNASGG